MNTNTIPLTFSPSTAAHDSIIKACLPKAADIIFEFLARRCKPGISQQFDKADFDEYCAKVGFRIYSLKWFKSCFKQLVTTRLVKVERVFYGHGYQVRLYHPWEVDDWVVDEFGNNRQKERWENKTSQDGHKTSQKSTSDPHDSVGDYRESREKSNTEANPIDGDRTKATDDRPKSRCDRPKPKPTAKKTASAAAPPKNSQDPLNSVKEKIRADGKEDTTATKTTDLKETASTGKKITTPTDGSNKKKQTAVSSLDKGGEHTNSRLPQSTGLKTDLNVNSGNVDNASGNDKNHGDVDDKVNKKAKKPNRPKFEVKINNQSWRSHLEELDQLGVAGNKTIVNGLKTFSTEKVEAVIALYRVRKRETGYIENPCGYFMQALKEDWAASKAKQVVNNDDPQSAEDQAALFRYWFDLAKELGYCSKSEEREGERWVCISGIWEKFTDAWGRGYNLEYLRKVKKRTTDP